MQDSAPPEHQCAILVWKFHEAPERYQKLSTHGGDEDWLAYIPDRLKNEWIGWMEEGGSFGCSSVTQHEVGGGLVKIGAHA
jgi:hypothetical protein